MAKTNIVPLGARIVVQPIKEEEKSASGIILPESASSTEKTNIGEVLAVGKLENADLSVGDKVLFSQYGYDTVEVDEEEYYVIKEDNVLAVIK